MNLRRGLPPLPNPGATIVDNPLFRLFLDLEVQKAQRLRYCVSLLCLAAEGDPPRTKDRSAPSLAEIVTPCIRGTDVVASLSPASLSVLLVDAETTHLPSILRRVTARLESGTWSAGGSCYPRTATRTDDMVHHAVDLMARAKEDGGNRLYVAS